LELPTLQVMLRELVEVVVADVVPCDRDLEARAAVLALDEPVDRLDVARVVDADRDDQRVLVRRDERRVAGPIVELGVVHLPCRSAFARKLADELAERRLVDEVTVRADEDDVAEVQQWAV